MPPAPLPMGFDALPHDSSPGPAPRGPLVERLRLHASIVLAAAGLVLTVTGIVLAVTGRSIQWTPLGISAQNAMRVVNEGLLALLGAAALRWDRCDRRTAAVLALVVALFHASLAGASRPRRVGDGHEYIAMARQLSTGSLPAIPESDLDGRRAEIGTQPGYDEVDLRNPSLAGRDGRQDFVHFWLYPLAVAPLLAAASHAHVHWNVAFTALNIALLAALAYLALLELPAALALALVAGPVIWWVDKAQIEVFNVALCGLAFLLLPRRPGPALVVLGVLSAQNPAFVAILGPATAWSVASARGNRPRLLAWTALAALVAAASPAYYAWHLGRPSPLADAAYFAWPSITAVLTPLVDPLCGFLWYVPGLLLLVVLALPGAVRQWRDRDVALAAWATAAFLAFFALAANVNHGGTPGPSRYGLWLLPLAVPLFRRLDTRTRWAQAVVPIVAIASMVHAFVQFHPRLPEQSARPPEWGEWMMERWPSLYDPLPEVFAERYGGTDGTAALPIASTGCGKVLLAGDGRHALAWPIPCLPAAAPAECTRDGALCYASRTAGGYAFSVSPRQPSFGYHLARDLTWRDSRELAWMPVQPRWERLERVEPFGPRSLVRGGRDLTRIRTFQYDRELLAFVDVKQGGRPVLELADAASLDVWVMTRGSRRAHHDPSVGPDGTIELPARGREALVLVRPRS